MTYNYNFTTAKPNLRISVLDGGPESESTSTTSVSRSGPVRFFCLFGQNRDWTGLQKFPFWEKTEPVWEKPVYIGLVLDICQR